jgi:hypothetical protein
MRSDLDFFLTVAALLVAAILAMSSLILAKKPDAKAMIDKLVPFQGGVGVGLLVWGIINLIRFLPDMSVWMKMSALIGAIFFASILSMILLGFLFGMPLIAKWIPGDSPAEQKALKMQQKVGGFSVLLGIIGALCAIGLLLIRFGIIKPHIG